MLNYLELFTKSKNEFSFRSYFYAFQSVINYYYEPNNNPMDSPEKKIEIEQIF
jgi:hypothetical protein